MLKLKVKVETVDGSGVIEDMVMASSGFIEPEVLLPPNKAKRDLKLIAPIEEGIVEPRNGSSIEQNYKGG